jgi:hypothetical protein
LFPSYNKKSTSNFTGTNVNEQYFQAIINDAAKTKQNGIGYNHNYNNNNINSHNLNNKNNNNNVNDNNNNVNDNNNIKNNNINNNENKNHIKSQVSSTEKNAFIFSNNSTAENDLNDDFVNKKNKNEQKYNYEEEEEEEDELRKSVSSIKVHYYDVCLFFSPTRKTKEKKEGVVEGIEYVKKNFDKSFSHNKVRVFSF